MYGTIGRFRIKAGMESQFRQVFEGQTPTSTLSVLAREVTMCLLE